VSAFWRRWGIGFVVGTLTIVLTAHHPGAQWFVLGLNCGVIGMFALGSYVVRRTTR
jgi:hypothetical protein